MTAVPSERVGRLAYALPSLSIGLLVGMLVGLSLSPVVAGVLTTLGGLLAAMLGLQSDHTQSDQRTPLRVRVNAIRIGAFGIACVAGILAGLYIRNHNIFGVSPKKQIAVWEDAGYTKAEARQFVAFQTLGLIPEGRTSVRNDLQRMSGSALFTALSEVNLCEKISMETYRNDVAQVMSAYRRLDLGDTKDPLTPLYTQLRRLVDGVDRLPTEGKREMLVRLQDVLCALERLK